MDNIFSTSKTSSHPQLMSSQHSHPNEMNTEFLTETEYATFNLYDHPGSLPHTNEPKQLAQRKAHATDVSNILSPSYWPEEYTICDAQTDQQSFVPPECSDLATMDQPPLPDELNHDLSENVDFTRELSSRNSNLLDSPSGHPELSRRMAGTKQKHEAGVHAPERAKGERSFETIPGPSRLNSAALTHGQNIRFQTGQGTPEKLQAQPVHLSLELLKTDKHQFMELVTNAIKTTLKAEDLARPAEVLPEIVDEPQLLLHGYGSAGAIIKYTRADRPPLAIKFHFGVNPPERPPHEITTMNTLADARTPLPCLPGYYKKASKYSEGVNSWFHTMDWYPCSLADLIKQYPQGVPESITRLLVQQLLILAAKANMQNYMLRNIKPQHILLREATIKAIHNKTLTVDNTHSCCLIIANYGHTRKVDRPHKTAHHTPDSSTGQCSIQDTHHKAYDEKADIRSIGMVLYELLTGKRLLDNIDPTNQPASEYPATEIASKSADHERIKNTVEQQLTGGTTVQSGVNHKYEQLWDQWCKATGHRTVDYPTKKFLGLFRLIYDRPPVDQPEDYTCGSGDLSCSVFFALCDLLQLSPPRDIHLQRNKEYWRKSVLSKSRHTEKTLEKRNKLLLVNQKEEDDTLKLKETLSCPLCKEPSPADVSLFIPHLKNSHNREEHKYLAQCLVEYRKDHNHSINQHDHQNEDNIFEFLNNRLCTYSPDEGFICACLFDTRTELNNHLKSHGISDKTNKKQSKTVLGSPSPKKKRLTSKPSRSTEEYHVATMLTNLDKLLKETQATPSVQGLEKS